MQMGLIIPGCRNMHEADSSEKTRATILNNRLGVDSKEWGKNVFLGSENPYILT